MTWRPRPSALVLAGVLLLVTVSLVGLARWEEARRDDPTALGASGGLSFPAEDWREVGPPCTAPTPECQVPAAVEVDGNLLVRTSLQVASSYVVAGPDASRFQARVDLPERRGWLMTGVVGGPTVSASGYRVELPDLADEETTARPLLVRVAGPRTSVPVVITARDPTGSDGRQFVAAYAFHPGQD